MTNYKFLNDIKTEKFGLIIDIGENRIIELEMIGVELGKRVEVLKLDKNEIEDLGNLKFYTGLKELYLQDNPLPQS